MSSGFLIDFTAWYHYNVFNKKIVIGIMVCFLHPFVCILPTEVKIDPLKYWGLLNNMKLCHNRDDTVKEKVLFIVKMSLLTSKDFEFIHWQFLNVLEIFILEWNPKEWNPKGRISFILVSSIYNFLYFPVNFKNH